MKVGQSFTNFLQDVCCITFVFLFLKLNYKDNGSYSCVVSNSLISKTKYLIIIELCFGMPSSAFTWSLQMSLYMILSYITCQKVGYKPWRSGETKPLQCLTFWIFIFKILFYSTQIFIWYSPIFGQIILPIIIH